MTPVLAFLLAVGREPRSESRPRLPWEWPFVAGFYGVMIWLACSELADLGR